MFTEVKGKPVRLLCEDNASVMKEYNIRRQDEISPKHTAKEKYKNMDMEQKLQKVELKRNLKSQQTMKSQITKRGCCQDQFYCGRSCKISPSVYRGEVCKALYAKSL